MSDIAAIASSPRRIRQRNELAVLRALHAFRRLSRADLARELRLNRSSSGNIIGTLLAAGLVREVEEGDRSGRAGRPGIQLELVPGAVSFLGVEIGVEHIAVVEINLAARMTRSYQEPFDGAAGSVGLTLARALDLAFATMPPDRLACCEGLGIAIPAQMDRHGFVRLAPFLGWRDLDLAEMTRLHLPHPLPVLAENDANAFAIGATYGHAKRQGVTLLVNMESGVGGGILVDGKLFRGGNGLSGEIGHLRMGTDAASATLEQQIGLFHVLQRYRCLANRAEAGLPQFLQAVQDREPGAVLIAEDWARGLAFALTQSCRVIDADQIVLGGSLAALYPLVSARVAVHLRSFHENSFPLPTISVADDIALGAAFGAACMMHQRFLSLENDRLGDAEVAE